MYGERQYVRGAEDAIGRAGSRGNEYSGQDRRESRRVGRMCAVYRRIPDSAGGGNVLSVRGRRMQGPGEDPAAVMILPIVFIF